MPATLVRLSPGSSPGTFCGVIAVQDGSVPLATPLSGDTVKVPRDGTGVCCVWVGSPDGVCVQLSTDSCQFVSVGPRLITDTVELGSMDGTLMALLTVLPLLSVVWKVPDVEARAVSWPELP